MERRKRETWLQFLWVLSDASATLVSFPLAYVVRFHSPLTELIPVTRGYPPIGPYVAAGILMSLAFLPLFAVTGLYRVHPGLGPVRSVLRVAQVAGFAVVMGAALTFFYRDFTFSRAYFPVLYGCLVAAMLTGRGLVLGLARRWKRKRPLRVVVVGESPSGTMLVDKLRATDPVGISLTGQFVARAPAEGVPPASAVPRTSGAAPARAAEDAPLPVLGDYTDVAEVAARLEIDVVIVALDLGEQAHAAAIVTACRGLPVDIELVPDVLQLLTRRARVRELDGLPVLSLREFPLTGWNAVKKRAFDVIVSFLALVVLAPLLVLLAALVKLTSPGPIFYAQERLGRDGRRFRILKFRSMSAGAEAASGPVWATRGDDRRTRLGRRLREWSLDELPQLLNVLRGQMSLVGPRPERPHFVSRFSEAMPDYLDRHRVKSGMTGWAQVNGLRGDTSVEERTRFDLFYVENWSLFFDLKILALTMAEVMRRREAY